MRRSTGVLTLALLAALPLLATAEIYKYVDENGVTRYTDKPPSKDAQPMHLPALQTYSNDSNDGVVSKDTPAPDPDGVLARGGASYSGVELVAPSPDQVFNTGSGSITAAANVNPGLQAGHSLVFLVDGLPFTAPPGQTSAELSGLARGTHSLQAVVMDDGNRIQAQSAAISFHMHQPSTLQPTFDPTPGSATTPSQSPQPAVAPGQRTRPPIVP